MPVCDLLPVMHAINVVWDEVHWSGAIESNHGDHMFQLGGFHLFEVAAHAGTFHLEQADRFSPTD